MRGRELISASVGCRQDGVKASSCEEQVFQIQSSRFLKCELYLQQPCGNPGSSDSAPTSVRLSA